MLNWVDPDTKEDGASSVVEETAVVTCETGEVTGDEVVNPSTIDKSVDPETEDSPPDADGNEENASDKEEEMESGEEEKEPKEEQKESGEEEKEPREEDKEPGEEHKESGEGVELLSRRNDEQAEEMGETQATRQHQTESHAGIPHAEVSNF